jgi:hypothetical protein
MWTLSDRASQNNIWEALAPLLLVTLHTVTSFGGLGNLSSFSTVRSPAGWTCPQCTVSLWEWPSWQLALLSKVAKTPRDWFLLVTSEKHKCSNCNLGLNCSFHFEPPSSRKDTLSFSKSLQQKPKPVSRPKEGEGGRGPAWAWRWRILERYTDHWCICLGHRGPWMFKGLVKTLTRVHQHEETVAGQSPNGLFLK